MMPLPQIVNNSFFGRRGEICWQKGNFAGTGWRRDYDAFICMTVMQFPVRLLELVHVFKGGYYSNEFITIPLREDDAYGRQVLSGSYKGAGTIILFFVFFVVGIGAFVQMGTQNVIRGGILCVASIPCLLVGVMLLLSWMRNRLDDKRDRDIRLILGMHAWGSSDPASWHPSLVALICPSTRLNAESYAMLVGQLISRKAWAKAMWAARLCAATEEPETGERLTTEILHQEPVETALRDIRNDPECRDKYFGAPISLATWIEADPEQYVVRFAVEGGAIGERIEPSRRSRRR